jgi:truncated hemoglobin YjbI
VQAASRESVGNAPAARITDLAFAAKTDLAGAAVFLCGNPDMVETARIGAVRAGAELDLIHADPFDPPQPYMTTETSKILAIEPDPELWAALEQGVRLTEILTEFYGEVYEYPRLAPFFHRVTKQRAIEKQYNFLQDLFHGTKLYFGEKPFNAHHWMVISDELFDYREKLFFAVVRRYDLAEPLIRRWAAIHETFRREIVKSAPRGILRDGREVSIEGYAREVLDVGAVCDGCFGEVHSGETVLMHTRTGEIFCEKCEGKHKVQAA